MHASHGEDRSATTEPDPDALLRMRIAMEDAAFVAEGITLGLLLKWAERAPPFHDLPPPVLLRDAARDGTRVSADR
jgi:hypothetical protein